MLRFLAIFLLASFAFLLLGNAVFAKNEKNTVVVLPKDVVVDTN